MRNLLLPLLVLLCGPAYADQARIEAATARQSGDTWSFTVTIRHPDTGWDHYADGWAVLAPDGTELGYRKLLHPHENEQPFTRALSGVTIPDGVTTVVIRAHDSVHGWSDRTVSVSLK
ncbi:MAG: hypothetical protein JXR14_11120 [Paracoccaceae bacterium]